MLFGLAFLAATDTADAQTIFNTLYDFQSNPDDNLGSSVNAAPAGGLIMDPAGNLYGTTYYGGTHNSGTVFELTPDQAKGGWTETVLYNFCSQNSASINCVDGAYPNGGVIMDASGNLYGTTTNGGGSGFNDHTWGTVFRLSPGPSGWTETALYSFCSQVNSDYFCTDGALPTAGLVMDGLGNLYGTANYTVFMLAPNASKTNWTETVLYSFCPSGTCTNALSSNGSLLIDGSGNLYGTTPDGAVSGGVFELMPNAAKTNWTEKILYSGGSNPGLLLDGLGNLYGTLSGGGAYGRGLVFKLTPDAITGQWTETALYTFPACGGFTRAPCLSGDAPIAGLVMDGSGNLYGTTAYGGAEYSQTGPFCNPGCGVVFKLTPTDTPPWNQTVLYSFCTNIQSNGGCPNGNFPLAGLIMDASGGLYGTTEFGGVNCQSSNPSGCGTVFKLSGAGTPLSENPQTSDFNADGRSDVLLQNASGQAAIWLMNGATATTMAPVGANPGTSWQAIGSSDFYGSLYSDILWQNTGTGEVYIWEINGTKVIGGGSPGNPGTSWHVIGTGDFNGDGKSDILLQNANGQAAIWLMNGAAPITPMTLVGANPGPNWYATGTGDFNGDGYSDILWQNTTSGQVEIWEMTGTKVIGYGSPGNPGTSWRAIGE